MKKITILILLLAFSITAYTQKKHLNVNNMTLEYSDGNGNHYKITPTRIVYTPITPEMSSSGTYSGGEPADKTISKSDFEKVYNEFELIFKEKTLHIEYRIKTSGRLVINKGQADEKKVIIKSSKEQEELEILLKSLLK